MTMNNPRDQEASLIIHGAISLFEQECLDIPSVLKQANRADLIRCYDALGAALYWLKQRFAPEEE